MLYESSSWVTQAFFHSLHGAVVTAEYGCDPILGPHDRCLEGSQCSFPLEQVEVLMNESYSVCNASYNQLE